MGHYSTGVCRSFASYLQTDSISAQNIISDFYALVPVLECQEVAGKGRYHWLVAKEFSVWKRSRNNQPMSTRYSTGTLQMAFWKLSQGRVTQSQRRNWIVLTQGLDHSRLWLGLDPDILLWRIGFGNSHTTTWKCVDKNKRPKRSLHAKV